MLDLARFQGAAGEGNEGDFNSPRVEENEVDHAAADLFIRSLGSSSSLRKKNYRKEKEWRKREDKKERNSQGKDPKASEGNSQGGDPTTLDRLGLR